MSKNISRGRTLYQDDPFRLRSADRFLDLDDDFVARLSGDDRRWVETSRMSRRRSASASVAASTN